MNLRREKLIKGELSGTLGVRYIKRIKGLMSLWRKSLMSKSTLYILSMKMT